MRETVYRIGTGLAHTPRQVSMFDAATGRWLASFTVDARTVLLRGPFRRFKEGPHVVAHAAWVRTYPEPFRASHVDPGWLAMALEANACRAPDVLAIAMQYIRGRPPIPSTEDSGLQVAGDARYGPMVDGVREEGADFNDYLGIAWRYSDDPTDAAERRQFRCLDCSGFVRMVFGYRRNLAMSSPGQVPLCRAPRADRSAVPRRAHEIASHGPGVFVVPPATDQVTSFSALAAGDLVFFDVDPDDGPSIDHVGIYFGRDIHGNHRFISSRKRANGPTMGDIGGGSILNGDGLYARAFRAARRL